MKLDGTVAAPAFAELTMSTRDMDSEKALRVFDSYFLAQILKGGSKPLGGEEGLLDGGQAGRMYRDFFHQELARVVAEKANIGLAQSLKGNLERHTGADPAGGSQSDEENTE